MRYIDRTVVHNNCDLKMTQAETGFNGWSAIMLELSKVMPSVAATLTKLSYREHCAIAKMPDPWHRESTISRIVHNPETKERALSDLKILHYHYAVYVESRTPCLLEQEHMSTMRWIISVLNLAGEENLADILDSFFINMKYREE